MSFVRVPAANASRIQAHSCSYHQVSCGLGRSAVSGLGPCTVGYRHNSLLRCGNRWEFMAHFANSFDVFDTLIARRCVDPRHVLDKLAACAGIPVLAAARLAADRQLGAEGRPYTLTEIWQQVGQALGLDTPTIQRLMALEIAIEHEEVIPIPENIALVRDGDVLVSDTYLPVEVIRSLLRWGGLERTVSLVVTNAGN